MKKLIRSVNIFLLAVLAVAMLMSFCACSESSAGKKDMLLIKILKIGKADCILITDENVNVIIDSGETEDADLIKAQAASMGIGKIDYLILTHYDKDHIGGSAELIRDYEIGYVIAPDYKKSSSEYDAYISALSDKDIEPQIATEPEFYSCGSFSLAIYPPQRIYEESNDMSLCVVVTHGENVFLFAGDITQERSRDILSEGQFDLACDFLKVPHHGAYDSNISEFLNACNPTFAVITCSNKNPADESVLAILDGLNAETYLTSQGDIVVTSDTKEIKITQNNR